MHTFVREVIGIGFAGFNRIEIEEMEEALLKKGANVEVSPDMSRRDRLQRYADLGLYTEYEMLGFRKNSKRYSAYSKILHFQTDSGKNSLKSSSNHTTQYPID